jgi:prepilin peptidase CpaA
MPLLSLLRLAALAIVMVIAVVYDVKENRIPNRLTVIGFLVALILGAFSAGGFPGSALIGAVAALAISIPFFALGALGGGDAKLFAVAGAFLGPGGLFSVFLYGGLAGGVLALASAARRGVLLAVLTNTKNLLVYLVTMGRRGERVSLASEGANTVPYGVAIAAGALLAWFFPVSL